VSHILISRLLRIGFSIADVEDWRHRQVIADDEDNLVPIGAPAWSFETREWIGDNKAGRNRNALKRYFVRAA
jgi:hypothetical protein